MSDEEERLEGLGFDPVDEDPAPDLQQGKPDPIVDLLEAQLVGRMANPCTFVGLDDLTSDVIFELAYKTAIYDVRVATSEPARSAEIVTVFEEKPIPYLAIGNSEPLPEGLPPELEEVVRQSRTVSGWCDHGKQFGSCCERKDYAE